MTRTRVVLLLAAISAITLTGLMFRAKLPRIDAWLGVTPAQDMAPMPIATDAAQAGVNRGDVSIDTRQQQLIGVRTATVARSSVGDVIRTVGAVRYDETRLSDVNVKVEGWIRDLYADYTGQAIRAGQPLFTLYSPALLSTESEYLLALTTRDRLQGSQVVDAIEQADRLVASARQRLTLWDLPAETIAALDETHRAQEAVTFRAPLTGVVMEKAAVKGLHVMPGQTLYKIADLSVVWVEADLYENELPLVRLEQAATVTLDAYPSERFTGRVVYIYPYLDEKTRANRVRIAFENSDGRLKPGMFANVELHTGAGTGLVVPVDAVLDSGTEQLVFVSQGDGHFSPRPVKVGRHFGGQVQILSGLTDGDTIATGAAFFLDSESQLRGGLAGYDAPPAAGSAPGAALAIILRTEPSPATLGENVFVVTVKDRDGKPIAHAEVSVQLLMPAMPTMNMPAMKNDVKLAATGNGEYRGTGQFMMAGRWDATVIVSQAGQRLGSARAAVVAR